MYSETYSDFLVGCGKKIKRHPPQERKMRTFRWGGGGGLGGLKRLREKGGGDWG